MLFKDARKLEPGTLVWVKTSSAVLPCTFHEADPENTHYILVRVLKTQHLYDAPVHAVTLYNPAPE